MIRKELLDRLRCTVCREGALVIGAGRRPDLRCSACDASFPIVDGIPDLIPPDVTARPGDYRADTLHELIAGVYDVTAPVMSLAVWHCSPLRLVDVEHRAIGRANPGGVYLRAPMGTGVILEKVLAPYHDVTIIGVDSSWKMLRRARKRFGDRVHLVRAVCDRLPLRDGVVDSIQSFNGLHAFTDRAAAIAEFERVSQPGAYLSGTALIRNQELLADVVLDRYERWGILPMLRTAEFLVGEMKQCGLENVRFETHGAVLFFSAGTAEASAAHSALATPSSA